MFYNTRLNVSMHDYGLQCLVASDSDFIKQPFLVMALYRFLFTILNKYFNNSNLLKWFMFFHIPTQGPLFALNTLKFILNLYQHYVHMLLLLIIIHVMKFLFTVETQKKIKFASLRNQFKWASSLFASLPDKKFSFLLCNGPSLVLNVFCLLSILTHAEAERWLMRTQWLNRSVCLSELEPYTGHCRKSSRLFWTMTHWCISSRFVNGSIGNDALCSPLLVSCLGNTWTRLNIHRVNYNSPVSEHYALHPGEDVNPVRTSLMHSYQ